MQYTYTSNAFFTANTLFLYLSVCISVRWIDLAHDRDKWGQVASSCVQGSEPSFSIIYGEFLD